MKIIYYISMILALCREFMSMWGMVVVCGRLVSHLKLPVTLRLLTRHGIRLPFKYASDFIWMLGKNNLDSFVSAGCFRYRQTRICCNCVLRPTETGLKCGSVEDDWF
jgi:hypothetical protein